MMLIMKVLNFLFLKGKNCKIEQKNNISINVFCYENNLVYPVHISNQNLKTLLMITDENKSQCVSIKDFNRFMCNKTKNINKNLFCKFCLRCFSSHTVLQEHKKVCLKINDKHIVKLKSVSIKSKNHLKQLAVPFKIYVDLELILKWIKRNNKKHNTSYTETYEYHIPCSYA